MPRPRYWRRHGGKHLGIGTGLDGEPDERETPEADEDWPWRSIDGHRYTPHASPLAGYICLACQKHRADRPPNREGGLGITGARGFTGTRSPGREKNSGKNVESGMPAGSFSDFLAFCERMPDGPFRLDPWQQSLARQWFGKGQR